MASPKPVKPKAEEMPIVFDRLKPYDKDRSGGLSVSELTQMPPEDVGSTFDYGHDASQSSYDKITKIFTKLPPTLRTSILYRIVAGSLSGDFPNEFMRLLAKQGIERVVDDIARDHAEGDKDGRWTSVVTACIFIV